MRVFLAVAALVAALLTPISFAEPSPDPALAAADRLVAAMGGAEAWSKARRLRIRATHWEAEYEAPYDNLILMSLDEPRMRFEADSPTMNRRRAVATARAGASARSVRSDQ